MESKNVSAVLHGKQDLRMEESEVKSPNSGEVLIGIHHCGICGTDMSWWTEGVDERYVTLPVVMGHESSGVIQAVGPDVTSLKPGDRVAIELGVPCRKCDLCKHGKYNLCKPWSYGGLQKYHIYPADFCHKIPDNMSLEEAALIEPLAVGVRAIKRAGVSIGNTVLICAAGAIGLSALMAAQTVGAEKICITDVSSWRLSLAKEMGATHTVLVDKSDTGRDIADKVCDVMGGQVDCTIECSGVESSLQAAIYATVSGGVVSPVALDPPEVTLPLVNAAVREVDIKGVFSYCNDYPAAIAMVQSKKVNPTKMITHRRPLSELYEAIQLVKSRQEGVLKVMIDCNQDAKK